MGSKTSDNPVAWLASLLAVCAIGAGACGGVFTLDFNARIASGVDPALVNGAAFWGQYWSRDSLSPSHTNLTNAITGVIGP